MKSNEKDSSGRSIPLSSGEVVESIAKYTERAHQRLRRRPRIRAALDALIHIDSLLGEGAYLPSNRRAAETTRLEAEQLRDEELSRQRIENLKRKEEQRRLNAAQLRQTIGERTTFDVEAYKNRRHTTNPWITVELGPNVHPRALNRPFEGESRYVALEKYNGSYRYSSSEVRGEVDEAFTRIKQGRPQENIELHDVSTFSEVGIADEVVIVYVYDDPRTDWEKLTDKAWSLLKPGGHLLIHDYTDHFVEGIADDLESRGADLVWTEVSPFHDYAEETPERSEMLRAYGMHCEELGLAWDRYGLDILIAQKPE